jgi:hypothetical protein
MAAGCGDDHARKSRVRADVTYPLDDTIATNRGDGKAGEITAEHETREDCVEVFYCHAQGDEGPEKPVCKLDAARRNDERSDLSAF